MGEDRTVVPVDFGKEQRESARKLARLLKMVEGRDDEMLKNPKKYFDLAADEIRRLQSAVRAAQEALCPPPVTPFSKLDDYGPLSHDSRIVDRSEWERWRAAIEIIQGARL